MFICSGYSNDIIFDVFEKKIILDDLIYTDEGTFQGCFDVKREYKSCLYNKVIAYCDMKFINLNLRNTILCSSCLHWHTMEAIFLSLLRTIDIETISVFCGYLYCQNVAEVLNWLNQWKNDNSSFVMYDETINQNNKRFTVQFFTKRFFLIKLPL